MNIFWKATNDNSVFPLFSTGHMIALFVIVGIIVAMAVYAPKLRETVIRKRVARIIGITLFLQQFLMYLWYITSGNFTIKESLPLYACRISAILCIAMMFNEKYSIFEIVYFWGLGGATQALITPDTGGFLFPHIMYLQFFVGHGGILIAVTFMIVAYEYRPTVESLKKAINWLIAYIFGVEIFNLIFKANYSYLRAKPATHSALDYLPPYPYYIPILFLIFAALFTVLYIPYFVGDIKLKNKGMENRTSA